MFRPLAVDVHRQILSGLPPPTRRRRHCLRRPPPPRRCATFRRRSSPPATIAIYGCAFESPLSLRFPYAAMRHATLISPREAFHFACSSVESTETFFCRHAAAAAP